MRPLRRHAKRSPWLFAYRATVLGALVLSILLQLAELKVAGAIYRLVKIEAEILIRATEPDPAPSRPSTRPPVDLRIVAR